MTSLATSQVALVRMVRAAMVDVNNPDSSIYFARNPNSGLVKIGRTRNVPRRMSELRVAVPDLLLLGHLPGGRQAEADLHSNFAADRVAGEWFRSTHRLAMHIALLLGAPE